MIGAGQTDERYFAHVRECWAALPQISPRERTVPAEILASWKRCADSGLTPQEASQRVQAMMSTFQDKTGREAAARSGCHAFSFGTGAQRVLISVVEFPPGQQENPTIAEDQIGTNAAALASRLGRGVFVNGPEHYAQALHNRYTYAEPIFDTRQRVCGVCSISSGSRQAAMEMRALVHILACIGSTIYWMELDSRVRENSLATLLNKVPQGVVYIDRKNVIRHFNRAALEVFGLKNTSEDSVIFARCVALICNSISEGKQSAIIDYRNNKKELDITAISLSDSPYEKLFLMEERGHTPAQTAGQQARWRFEHILTVTPALKQAKERAAQAAAYHVPVMLVGKSGVGKEMFAQAIHNASMRSKGPFVALNASAIAPSLVESALFGYERGAFTGASQEGKQGYFEAASGGTLFLDELDSIPFDVQTKLLRAISSKRIRRVGGSEYIPVDVRLISAGRVDVLQLAREGTFREDLYYRLSPVKILIPDLSQRREDIPLLVRSFLEREARKLAIPCPEPSQAFLDCLKRHDWPGNVRELHNALRHALVFLEPGQLSLEPDMLPDFLQNGEGEKPSRQEAADGEESVLKLAGMVAVCETLRRSGGNAEQAGKRLGLSTATVYNYMARARRCGLNWEETER